MKPALLAPLAAILALLSAPAMAEMAQTPRAASASAPGTPNGEYLQCVPYARQVSGVRIFGDAHTWWDQAEGRYRRGNAPRVGAVMAFEPHRNMRLGHVAAVSRVIDSRTVLIRHANWSEIDGRRGLIEDDVRAVDVSAANDWSEVRVWYAPSNGLGTTAWPVRGFIYPDTTPTMNAPRPQPQIAARAVAPARTAAAPARTAEPARVAPPPRVNAVAAAPRAAATPPRAAAQQSAPRTNTTRRDEGFAAAMAMDQLGRDTSFEESFAGLR